MAHAFCAFAVPDAHIAFLERHQGMIHAYLEGSKPQLGGAELLPNSWPEKPVEGLGSWSLNHRNPDLYHWILNGGPELLTGVGSIFQTWYEPSKSSALKLDQYNERFAFYSHQLPELALLVHKVTVASVGQAFLAWCKRQGKSYEPDEYACQPFVDEFTTFGKGLDDAIRAGNGLIW